MPKISHEQLTQYFSGALNNYPLATESVKLYNSLRVHADGEFPADMIKERRPSETDEILQYREDTYKPITKLPLGKVVNSFSKIRRSPDWAIEFPSKSPASILPNETLETYCTTNLPGYDSITNWAFGVLLKQMLIDANAVIIVIPFQQVMDNAYAKPIPVLYNSNQVVIFDEKNKFAILRSKRTIKIDGKTEQLGNVFIYVDEKEIIIYEQGLKEYNITFQQPNYTRVFPAFKVRAEIFKQIDDHILCRSRLDAMVPFLDEAACEYSDLKGSKIQHLYPLFWYYQNKECTTCKGLGELPTETGKKQCTECAGSGKVKFSPFAHIQVDVPGIDKQQTPTPPAGYVERDTAILELQDKSVDKNILKALSAVNMQFLDQTPLSISGDAKQVDREELNNTVYNVAEDLVYALDKVMYLINEWRYKTIVADDAKRKAMLPLIAVPQNFDLLPEDYLVKDVTDARNAKVNPLLIAMLEQQLAAKKFYTQPQLAHDVKLLYDLDPLVGYTTDEKMTMLQNNGCTEIDYIISNYITPFIKRAVSENKQFYTLSLAEQYAQLSTYANEKINAIGQAKKAADDIRQQVLTEMQTAQ